MPFDLVIEAYEMPFANDRKSGCLSVSFRKSPMTQGVAQSELMSSPPYARWQCVNQRMPLTDIKIRQAKPADMPIKRRRRFRSAPRNRGAIGRETLDCSSHTIARISTTSCRPRMHGCGFIRSHNDSAKGKGSASDCWPRVKLRCA